MSQRFDVVSLGSTMLRLSVPPGMRLETAPRFDVHTAGTESNTMTALARLGRKTAWASRLVDNPLGRRIANEIRYHGVDVSGVIWAAEGRNETFYVEYGAAPRPIQVVYDRHPSVLAQIDPDLLDLDFLTNGRFLHMTGILPALSDNCVEAARRTIKAARDKGLTISFDVNYRAKLWSPEQAAETLTPLMEQVDYLIMTAEDAEGLFGLTGDPADQAAAVRGRFGVKVGVVTAGIKSAAYDGTDHYHGTGFEKVEVIDRLGAGDAFNAGLLHGLLDGDLQKGIDYGMVTSAMALGIKGDYFVSYPGEVEAVLAGRGREVGR